MFELIGSWARSMTTVASSSSMVTKAFHIIDEWYGPHSVDPFATWDT